MIIIDFIRIIRSFTKKLSDDYVGPFAAQAAYYIFISFIPFVIFFMALLKYIPVSVEELFSVVKLMFPETITGLLSSLANQIIDSSSGAVISVSIVTALWMASKSFYAIVKGLRGIYKKKQENYIISRLFGLLYTVVFAVVLIAIMIVYVFGNWIYHFSIDKFPILENLSALVLSFRLVIGLAVLTLVFAIMYKFCAGQKSSLLKSIPGAVISAIGWIVISYAYSIYIDRYAWQHSIYGSLTAIILLLIWLYAIMYMMFIGAEINRLLFEPEVREELANFVRSSKNEWKSKIDSRNKKKASQKEKKSKI